MTSDYEVNMCDIWCIYRFGGLIDGYSALGVVYEVSLEVVMTTHAWGCHLASASLCGTLESGRLNE